MTIEWPCHGQRLWRPQGDEQVKRLAGATAVQVDIGKVWAALNGVRDGRLGLLGGFTLALHAAPAQAFDVGLVLPALHGAVRRVGRCFGDVVNANMVAHAFEPVALQERLQRLFPRMQAQPIAQRARVLAVIGKTDADVAQPVLHQGEMQAVV